MNIFDIIKNLYTNPKSNWILELEDNEIEPYKIQHFLIMNSNNHNLVRVLDKFVFALENKPKMYLSLAWSVIADKDGKKFSTAPFIKYIKKEEKSIEFDFIISRVRKHLELSDNDFRANERLIMGSIKSDMTDWFKFYGIEKEYWKNYKLDFNDMFFVSKNIQKVLV